jgi:hypothetical protein
MKHLAVPSLLPLALLAACSNPPEAPVPQASSPAPEPIADPVAAPAAGARRERTPEQRRRKQIHRFEKIDINGDGFIAAGEVPEGKERSFARFDTDGDGRVSQAEFLDRAQAAGRKRRRDRDAAPGAGADEDGF